MLHTFKILDKFYTYDTQSGSLAETDEMTFEILNSKISPDYKGDFSRYNKKDLLQAQNEIDQLIREGILFAEESDLVMPEYSGIIKAMCLNICHNCNLNCGYCFADAGTYNGQRANMSLETACAAIDFLIKNSGTRHNLEVDFFGGEPTLNLDVVKQTVEYAKEQEKAFNKNFRFTITTNALTLNDDMTDFFNRYMYNVVISIDGRKNVHNQMRKDFAGNDTFDRVIKNALRFKEKRGDLQYFIRGTYTALNKDFANDVLFLSDLGFDRLSIEPVVLHSDNPLALKQEDTEFLLDQYEYLLKEIIQRRKNGKEIEFFHFMLDLKHSPCIQKRLKGCGAGGEYIAVSPNGNIYPCHQFDSNEDFLMGNVNTGEFNTSLAKKMHDSNLTAKPECQNCFAKYYCSGGCVANSYKYCGDLLKPYKIVCALVRKRLECALALNAVNI